MLSLHREVLFLSRLSYGPDPIGDDLSHQETNLTKLLEYFWSGARRILSQRNPLHKGNGHKRGWSKLEVLPISCTQLVNNRAWWTVSRTLLSERYWKTHTDICIRVSPYCSISECGIILILHSHLNRDVNPCLLTPCEEREHFQLRSTFFVNISVTKWAFLLEGYRL